MKEKHILFDWIARKQKPNNQLISQGEGKKRGMAEDWVLDTAIRDWGLIPLSVVMVLIGVLRYFVSKLMRRSSQLPDPKIVKEGYTCLPLIWRSMFWV